MFATASLLLAASTSCSATYTDARMDQNPLPRIAEAAASNGYTVFAPSEDRLEIRDTWIALSVLSLGWSTFHANLDYREGRVFGEFYLRSVGLGTIFTLFAPQYVNLGPGFYGALLKPALNEQKSQVLRWGEVPEGRTSHEGFVSIDERARRLAPEPAPTAAPKPAPKPTPTPAPTPPRPTSPPARPIPLPARPTLTQAPPPARPSPPSPPPTSGAPAFCGSCGTRIAASAKFCGGCGAKVQAR